MSIEVCIHTNYASNIVSAGVHRKGMESFLSVGNMGSIITSVAGMGKGAGSMLAESAAELTSMSSAMSSSTIGSSVVNSSTIESGTDDDGSASAVSEIEEMLDDEEEDLLSEIDIVQMEANADLCEDENVKNALKTAAAIKKAECSTSD